MFCALLVLLMVILKMIHSDKEELNYLIKD